MFGYVAEVASAWAVVDSGQYPRTNMRQTRTRTRGDRRWRNGDVARASALLLLSMAIPATLVGGCRNQSEVRTLPGFDVDLKWDRPGTIELEVSSIEADVAGDVVSVSFSPSGSVPLQRIERRFEVSPSVEPLEAMSEADSPVELERLAQRAIRDHYPQLSSNAEATVSADRIPVGDVSIEMEGRPTMARVMLEVRPEDARDVGTSQERLAARAEAARLVRRDRLDEIVLAGELATTPGGGDVVRFDLSSFGAEDCRTLRSILEGEVVVQVVADVDRRGRSTRTSIVLEAPWVDEGLREAAWSRLTALAEGGRPSDLELRLDGDASNLVHGESLPAAAIVNVGRRPVIRLSSPLYQVEYGEGTTVLDRFLDEVDCLCPGERIELPAPSPTDPCLDGVRGSEGLRYVVKSTREREIFGLRVPETGGFEIAARPVGDLLILPIASEERPVVEAEDLGGDGARDLELLLVHDGETLRARFPDVPARGRASLVVPDALDEAGRETWARWIASAQDGGDRTVNLELLESWRFDCDGAEPARQRLRLP